MRKDYDLIIVGAGPAGMTAGIYASRLSLKTLLITKSFGGQVSSKAVEIENYPGLGSISGPDLVRKIEEHFKSLKVEFELDEVKELKKEDSSFFILSNLGKEYGAKSVILASGAESKHLNVPGEKEYIGRGVSYCSLCDGPMFRNKTVAIVGGGNAGFETAIFLSNIAKKIYILEFTDEVKAFDDIQKTALASNKVEVIIQAKAKEIRGDKLVNSFVYEDRKTGEEKILEVQGVFIEIGYSPASSFIKELVEFNGAGEIMINLGNNETKTPGLFAAGDITAGKFKQIIIAAGDGAKAALAAHNFIKKKSIDK